MIRCLPTLCFLDSGKGSILVEIVGQRENEWYRTIKEVKKDKSRRQETEYKIQIAK